jgi:hypothetical protein
MATTLETLKATWIQLKTQLTTPPTPPVGYGWFYDKNKTPAFINSDGVETILGTKLNAKTSRAINNSSQTINTSASRIQFNTVEEDTESCITTGASWVFTVPHNGIYSFDWIVSIQTGVEIFSQIFRNGSPLSGDYQQPSTGSWQSAKGTWTGTLSIGDTIYIMARLASGSAGIVNGWGKFFASYWY